MKIIRMVMCLPMFIAIHATSSIADEPRDTKNFIEVQPVQSSNTLHVTGRIVPQDGALHIESARVQGRVTSILRREGESVVVGTPLFEVNSADCISLVDEKAIAEERGLTELLESAKRRETQLGVVARAGTCEVLAHFAGVLTKRNIESGSAFNAGDPLVTILDTNKLMVELDVPEQDLNKVMANQVVHLRFPSLPSDVLDTTVQYVVPAIDTATRTLRVKLSPVSLPKGPTLDGLVFGDIETGSNENIFQVATSALVFSHNKQYLVKLTESGPTIIAVQVISESEESSSVRPTKAGELQQGDHIVKRDALFLFHSIITGSDT